MKAKVQDSNKKTRMLKLDGIKSINHNKKKNISVIKILYSVSTGLRRYL